MTITFSQLGKMGRLGNCLFQISTTIATAKQNKTDYLFPHWEYEKDFNLHSCFSSHINPTKTYQEKAFHYDPIPPTQHTDLVGYWQSWRYFESCKNDILNLFTPIHHFEREPGLCSIHVRRGDYLKFQDCHPLMEMNYYTRAMEKSGCQKFLMFSDDMEWVKKWFVGDIYEYSENTDPAVDLAMMVKRCESNIICNSSFSWWGAYLNQSQNKTVVAPQKWFGPKLPHNTKDLLPEEWIKI